MAATICSWHPQEMVTFFTAHECQSLYWQQLWILQAEVCPSLEPAGAFIALQIFSILQAELRMMAHELIIKFSGTFYFVKSTRVMHFFSRVWEFLYLTQALNMCLVVKNSSSTGPQTHPRKYIEYALASILLHANLLFLSTPHILNFLAR